VALQEEHIHKYFYPLWGTILCRVQSSVFPSVAQ
jgi:hypothetical protein